ncbi:MAG TPA: chemotaxis protein CheW [Halanaerobiales bacterium]|nr:chemotaxis protein CheW [Halanaerobiales bacterium]
MANPKKANILEQDNTGLKEQYLTFNVGSEIYGLKLEQAKEIIKPPKVTNVPNTEEYILGVINLRGQVIPVINLKNKLGLKAEFAAEDNEEKTKKIVVINIKDMLIGLYVDGVNEVINLPVDEIEGVSDNRQGIREEFIQGVSSFEDALIIVLDIDNLLFSEKEEKGA